MELRETPGLTAELTAQLLLTETSCGNLPVMNAVRLGAQ